MFGPSEHPRRRRGGSRRPACTLGVAVALAAAATLVPSAGAEIPCGIARPVDHLFRCYDVGDEQAPASTAASSASAQTSGSDPAAGNSPQSASAAAAPLTELPPRISSGRPAFVPNLLLVRFRASATAAEDDTALARAGVTPVEQIPGLGVVVVRMAPSRRSAALAALRSSAAVASAGLDQVLQGLDVTPNDQEWSTQWGLRQVAMPSAWDRTRGGNVVVAVLDTGVDAEHPDLQGAVLAGINLVDPSSPPADDNGHGTAVAGIIAARTDNRIGVAGICWTCSILPIKVLGADGSGDTATVAAGIVRAADAGARVISMSLGGPAPDPTLSSAVSYAEAKGAILVAAAGNSSSSTPFYPAADPGVVSVAGTDESSRLYDWSDYGSWVQVAAPGCDSATGSTGGYVEFCGTSAAAPVVAGLAALALSVEPEATRSDVVAAIERTATPMGNGVSAGIVDASAALAALGVTTPDTVHVLAASGSLRASVRTRVYRFSVPAGLLQLSVASPGSTGLAVTVRTAAGVLVGSARGRSPLEITSVVPAEALVATVTGATRSAYRISVSVLPDVSSGSGPQ